MILLIGILRRECRNLHRWNSIYSRSMFISPRIDFHRSIHFHLDHRQSSSSSSSFLSIDKCLSNSLKPFQQTIRWRKLKFSFGYTNYGHRRHIRPPGHHVVHYMQFFFIIIGVYAIFYFTNVSEYEDRWIQPADLSPIAESNSFINSSKTQRSLDIFANVKAATRTTISSIVQNSSEDQHEDKEEEEEETKKNSLNQMKNDQMKKIKTKISFRDKKKIAYENRLRAFSTPDKIFRYFATLKVFNEENPDGMICMTPDDFLRSITPGLKQPDGLELDKFQRYDTRTDSSKDLEKLNQHVFYSELNSNEISIFERIGGKQCLITFSDYVFLVTVLSTPRRYFQIAFQMFDLDGNGTFDFDEFTKLKNLIRTQTSIGQRHRDHSTTGNILKENSILNQYFFGENLDQLLSVEKFLQFYEQLQNEILLLEFHRSTKSVNDSTRMTEVDFAQSLLAYSGLPDRKVKKMLKRIKTSYPINDPIKSKGISFEDYRSFYNFLRNIHDIDVALTFYHIAGSSIDKQIFRHVAKIVNHIDLDEHLIDVVFTLFDQNDDQLLSYVEFIHIMKDRLERGLQKPKDTAFIKLVSTLFTCAKDTFL